MTDASSFVGNGIIRRNTIQGQTFVGASAAQVLSFGTMSKSGTVLSARTIRFSEMSGITAPHAGNSQGSEITPGLRVVSISGDVVTVSANIPDAVSTVKSFSFGNVQFNFPNVARQLVVIQSNNLATQFLSNTVKGSTGSGISYNTAATIDTANAIITSNIFKGSFKYGYPLRARGVGASVNNNVNYSLVGKENAGYLIGPTGSQVNGYNIGTNTTVTQSLVSASQSSAGQPVATTLDKAQLKLVPKLSSSVAFSDESTWKIVSCIFKKAGSSQRIVMSFRDFSAQKLGKLKAGMSGGDNFQLHKIIISKSDRSLLVINRSDITEVSDNDFALKS